MLKLHGTSKSRAARSLWALEELGLKYDHNPVEVPKAKGADNVKLNPNGHIPVLEDDGHVVWESMAINLYLADKYGKPPFWPSTPEGRSECTKWSFFGMTEVEPRLMTILVNKLFLPAEQRDEKAVQKATEDLKAILSFALLVKLDLSATPAAQTWLQKCLAREGNARVRKLG
jgi:glutathione S-transferase